MKLRMRSAGIFARSAAANPKINKLELPAVMSICAERNMRSVIARDFE